MQLPKVLLYPFWTVPQNSRAALCHNLRAVLYCTGCCTMSTRWLFINANCNIGDDGQRDNYMHPLKGTCVHRGVSRARHLSSSQQRQTQDQQQQQQQKGLIPFQGVLVCKILLMKHRCEPASPVRRRKPW